MPAKIITVAELDTVVAHVKAARGTCSICMKRHELRKSDGMLVTHKHLLTKCTGSYTAPVALTAPTHRETEQILAETFADEISAVLDAAPKRTASTAPKNLKPARSLKSVPAQTSRDRSSDLISVDAARAEFPTLTIAATVSGRFPHLAIGDASSTLCRGTVKQGRTAPVLDQGMCPNCTRVARKL